MNSSTNDKKRRRQDADDSSKANLSEHDGKQSSKKAKVEDRRSIFVRSLPPNVTNESLADFFSQYFPVKHATVVIDQKTKESRGFGFVSFADADDARDAKVSLDKKEWDGRQIRIDVAEPRHRNNDAKTGGSSAKPVKSHEQFPKPPKLIIRNLPWSIKTSEQLAKLFISFGKVKFADLPQKNGKLKGFGFVTIRGRPNAEKAIEVINGKVIDGRTLAVDWAVDRETWEHSNQENNKKDIEDEDDGKDDDVVELAPGDDASDDNVKNRDDQLDADLANFMKNHMQNMEDEDDDAEGEEEDEDEQDEEELKLLDDDDEEEKAETTLPQQKSTDNSSTVFVRNLPFTTTDEQLKSFFYHFGKIRYARVVIDRATEKPAGTGFVCFFDKGEAKACIVGAPRHTPSTVGVKHSILQDENADPTGKYTLDGRVLQVVQAVNKQEATNLAENSLTQRREKDKRRLYLLSEGSIGSNSPLYGFLTEPEVRMRQASAAQRKKLVQKNPMLHISLTRLALRNIPRNIGAKELKELARKAVVGFAKDVKEGKRQPLSKEENARDGKDAKEKEKERKMKRKGIVRQAKVVYEDSKGTKVSETSGAGKSRGYGFIEYTSHRWALMGLRYLNGLQLQGDNNKKQRLIVEFAIENVQVVKRRQETEERAAKQSKNQPSNKDDHSEPAEEESSKRNGPKQLRGKKGKGRKGEDQEPETDDIVIKKPTNAREALQQKLIARKRQVRKKKATARGRT